MTTATLPAPRPTVPDVGDFDPVHLTCCDDDIAMCGADVSGEEYGPYRKEDTCAMCVDVEESGRPCPVPGCPGTR